MSDSASDRPSDGASGSPSESARRPFPDVLEVVVEIPSGSRNKQVEIHGWADLKAALDLLRADRDRWTAEQDRPAEQQP